MIDYNVISTGSKGNATVINSAILIDCGVPFKALQNVYKKFQMVLLTHCHTDHFSRATIKRLAQERPALRWGAPEWLAQDVLKAGVNKNAVDLFVCDCKYSYGLFDIETFFLPHDVPNMGYKIALSSGERMLYATDTRDLSHVYAPDYDLYLVEANHTEDGIRERIQAKESAGEYVYEYAAMQNHFSKEKCDTWLYENMGGNSEYVYMHQHID